ncbi:MAG TPA: DsbC family protein [Steroidobacteraceae bacterium]|nr:DsbC family protein [Steroidobacteraceae bacterium]
MSFRIAASLIVFCMGAGSALAQTGSAATPAAPAAAKPDPRAVIVNKLDGIKLEDVRISPVNGVYEVTRGSEISYLTADGRYAILGDLIDLDTDANISENRRRGIRARILEGIPESEMLVFSPKDPKYTITVFTDIDCGYCRRLHSQMAEYNRLGIRVRYLFFPRSGPATESWHKAEAVWCASNRNEALTKAKKGEALNSAKCPTAIVQRDFDLGLKLLVEGTPAIFLPSGEMLPGYLPPGQLTKYLKTGKM